ncbi:hypothetical protein [Streptomyces sp. NPDC093795]|uniref:hypothetical protein n=1 Tax=Streptomyces sp. NPDC093795 TaxID=3366051 RepID=UPI003817AD3B
MRSFRIRRSSGMPLLGGARPPVSVLSALLLSRAAFAALGLGRAGHDEVPEAVRASQQHVAEDTALAMRASLDESVTDLERVAALFNAGPRSLQSTAVTYDSNMVRRTLVSV